MITKLLGRATQSDLDALHGIVAETIAAQLRAYLQGDIKDPKTDLPALAPAALVGQAISFLKSTKTDLPDQTHGDHEDAPDEDFISMIEAQKADPATAGSVTPEMEALYQQEVSKRHSETPPEPHTDESVRHLRAKQSPVERALTLWCINCQTFHPVTDFARNRARSTGYQNACKKSRNQKKREKYHAEKDQPEGHNDD